MRGMVFIAMRTSTRFLPERAFIKIFQALSFRRVLSFMVFLSADRAALDLSEKG